LDCQVIAFTNQAGGVGKSTTVVNVACFLAEHYKVAVVDFDGQQTTTMNFGVNPYACTHSIHDALLDPKKYPFKDIVLKTEYGVDLVPASEELYAVDINLVNYIGRESRLQKFLEPARRRYDYILVDLPPSLGLIQVNGLNAADYVVIVCQAHPKSFNGLNMLLKTIDHVKVELNEHLQILGALVTIFESRAKVCIKTMDKIKSFAPLQGQILDTVIRKNVTLAEAGHVSEEETDHGIAILGKPIRYYDPIGSSVGYKDYQQLALEIMQRTGAAIPNATHPAE
jgi:chromosome partitioning protein